MSKNKDLDQTFWYTRQYKAGLLNLESKVSTQNNMATRKRKKRNIWPLIIILILLLGVTIGGTVWYFGNNHNNEKDKKEEEVFQEKNNIEDNIKVVEDIDTVHIVTSFEKFHEEWGNDYTKSKSFKIQQVTLNKVKASLYFTYTYTKVSTNEKEGTSRLTIKHGDNLIYDNITSVSVTKPVITYIALLNNDYLIVGEKKCSVYNEESKECKIDKTEGFYNLLYSNGHDTKLFYGIDDKTNTNVNITNDNDYYIYDVSIDNSVITFKTLQNYYKAGIYSCDSTYYSQDVYRSYVLTYIGNGNFLTAVNNKSVQYSEYCANKSKYDWNIEK